MLGMQSDFNAGTGAIKKKWQPGNAAQQNTNPFGSTERGFKPATLKKALNVSNSYSGGHGGLSSGTNGMGRPPMPGGHQKMQGYQGGMVPSQSMLPPLPQAKLPAQNMTTSSMMA